ncbi:MAG: DNA methyltransferase [Candidatus Woykebacteria bacterium RIFCSPHIGHO2_12_FULL_45_10]|uniref:site-specific DNA-methyltransferase (adenine-specific) n=1 Tax=Candidatus Woykebacteria bacterium RIFCSPHIGHO2_12_FULL_45_10 TaxID=1802603 RepID=A0A1G1WNX6_9BACT|nr:MAG: DNA methyltransferase [Candidatus Woykebacteria bacterium RIFCSPHIGHO2_12_FULL_45_10]
MDEIGVLPSTRYQGSKYKILDWINYHTQDLQFDTVLDAFGGTGSVGYMFKSAGKQVTYNDSLKFNYYIGLALIENPGIILTNDDVNYILKKHQSTYYPSFIYDNFHDIYFTDDENQWLDIIITNIRSINDIYKQAMAYYALFQACIIKRPYNLFHRKNLYVRTADVKRSFGNKKTWDTPFRSHFLKFIHEANRAVFDNNRKNTAHHSDIFELNTPGIDLVYIDTPYISQKGVGVNYFDFYHFLEGIVFYDQWDRLIDRDSKHKKIKNGKNEWCKKDEIHQAFEKLFAKFADSILVVSYRDDGTPTIDELAVMLKKNKKSVSLQKSEYKYALSKTSSKEVLLIGT